MKVLFVLHLYFPQHGAGGERMCHNLALHLKKQGHDVIVLLTEASHYDITQMYEFEGITVMPAMKDVTPAFAAADIIFTHLSPTQWAIHLAHIYKKPLIFVSHNTHFYDMVASFPEHVSVLYNSNAAKKILNYPNPGIVVHPPVDYRKWDYGGDASKAVYITLINLNANKGAKLFMALAKAMPERMFLGVGGSYDSQYREELPNVTYLPNSPDMEPVYARTRVLICPSKYESWGMCATEAMCNGIPVIYNPTFGLQENVGQSGIAVPDANPGWEDLELKGGEDPDGIDPVANLQPWIEAIRSLDDPELYQLYSEAARDRSRELDPKTELSELDRFIWQMIERTAEVFA